MKTVINNLSNILSLIQINTPFKYDFGTYYEYQYLILDVEEF